MWGVPNTCTEPSCWRLAVTAGRCVPWNQRWSCWLFSDEWSREMLSIQSVSVLNFSWTVRSEKSPASKQAWRSIRHFYCLILSMPGLKYALGQLNLISPYSWHCCRSLFGLKVAPTVRPWNAYRHSCNQLVLMLCVLSYCWLYLLFQVGVEHNDKANKPKSTPMF